MKGGPIVATGCLVLVASLALAPTASPADRFHGGPIGGRGVVSGPVVGRPFVAHPFVGRPFVHRPFFRPFIPIVIASPVVVYTPPAYYSAPPTYYDSPAYYDPPAAYGPAASSTVAVAPAPDPPPTPSVVQYPTGRYELRGDGVTTPYTWVWIPNPPPPPPPAGAPPGPPVSGEPSSAHHGPLYRWIDEQSVVHWTDRWDAVPTQYRAQAKRAEPL
jgi:hypothetical protein